MQWQIILKKRGYNVIEARSGEELLGMRIDFETIQTAIVDYQYEDSDLNGLDVVEYLKRKNVERIYLCTANYQDKEIVQQAKALGVASIIAKPIHLKNLETILS
jgi:CheY-like chemotaxis protein